MSIAALVIGHGPRIDKGAVNKASGKNEYDYNSQLVRYIAAELAERKICCVIVHRAIERVQPTRQTNETNADIAMEFHLNSGGGTGPEMIIWPTSTKARRLAELLQLAAVQVLRLPNRGVKPPWKDRGKGWLTGTKMPAVIVESFFVDNDKDLEVGLINQKNLAKAYAEAIATYFATLQK